MPLLKLDDGTFIAESVAICRYVEELHPQPSLFGTTPFERAMIEMSNRRMEFELLRPITDHFVNLSPFWEGRRTQVAQAGHVARAHAESRMRWLNDQLATRPFIAGDHYTIADITAQCACVSANTRGHPSRPSLLTSRNGSVASPSDRPSAPEDDLGCHIQPVSAGHRLGHVEA
jgi:glutathione S-transferase